VSKKIVKAVKPRHAGPPTSKGAKSLRAGRGDKSTSTSDRARSTPSAPDSRLKDILAMARIMVADVGIDGLNMRDLAADTKSSLRTLYTNFGSKEQLLARIVADTFDHIFDISQQKLSKSQSGADNILELLQSLAQAALDTTMAAKAFMGIYYKHDNVREVPDILYGTAYERVGLCVDRIISGRETSAEEVELLKEEITDRIFSVVMKWSQKMIPDEFLVHRLIYSALTCLRPYATIAKSNTIDRAVIAALKQLTKP
jgi:AcrR family transcriptional regulator